MNILLDLASAFGLSTSAGLNAYIPLLTLAVLARFTPLAQLEEPWSFLTNGWIIALIVALLIIDVLADKFPVVDSINDVVQTLVRPTAGAILFAATTQSSIHIHPLLAMGCGVILAGGVHVIKAGARPVLTAATGGTANPIVSTLEEIVSAVTAFLAIIFPYIIILWFILLLVLIALILKYRHDRKMQRRAH